MTLAHVITPRGHLVPLTNHVRVRATTGTEGRAAYVVETLLNYDGRYEPLCACSTREEAEAALRDIVTMAAKYYPGLVDLVGARDLTLIADQLEEMPL